jgi:hypothetical protein
MMAPTYRNLNILSCSNLKLAYPSNKNHDIITLERNRVAFGAIWQNLNILLIFHIISNDCVIKAFAAWGRRELNVKVV